MLPSDAFQLGHYTGERRGDLSTPQPPPTPPPPPQKKKKYIADIFVKTVFFHHDMNKNLIL